MKRGSIIPSLLILLGLVLWMARQRSERIEDWFLLTRHSGFYLRLYSGEGIVRCEWAFDDPFPGGMRWNTVPAGTMIGMSSGRRWEKYVVGEICNSPAGEFDISYFAMISAFLGAGLLLGANPWRRDACKRKSLANRMCANCGYDLRASGNRCPECGTIQQLA